MRKYRYLESWEKPFSPTYRVERMGATYEEGVIDVGQNCIFGDNVIHLLELDDICLLEDLHCEVLASLFITRQPYSSKGTYPVIIFISLYSPVPKVVVSS